ncbi:hypothetical protein [Pedobacter frigoris]|uniref:hypothetical protein n=1 Tax=Pedobacter frigoris TaxID=2571272 RepID=UPI002931A3A1|nr:hypothetical protein [Pedobacter frigoris]
MLLTKHISKILVVLILFIASCKPKSPYKIEEIIFNIPQEQVFQNLDNQFKFEKVKIWGLKTEGTDQLHVEVTNSKKYTNELLFTKELAKSIKNYVKNIDHYSHIIVNTVIMKKNFLFSTTENKNTVFRMTDLSNISYQAYFEEIAKK